MMFKMVFCMGILAGVTTVPTFTRPRDTGDGLLRAVNNVIIPRSCDSTTSILQLLFLMPHHQ